MTIPFILAITNEGWLRLDAPKNLGQYLRRLCRMAYGIHLHAPMRGCHITLAEPGDWVSTIQPGGFFDVSFELGHWYTNNNAIWTPVECPGLDFDKQKHAPHLCIGYLTNERTRYDTT